MTDTGPQPYRRPVRIGLADAVQRCVRKSATFSGRAPRAEYGTSLPAIQLAIIALILLKTALIGPTRLTAPGPGRKPQFVSVVHDAGPTLSLACLLPLLAAMWRRLRDTGRSGGWPPALAVLQFLLIGGVALAGPLALWSAVRETGSLSVGISGPAGLVIPLMSIGAWTALIVFLARRGTPGPNRFGPNPLEVFP